MSSLHFCRRMDSFALSAGVRSGLMEIFGRCDSLALLDSIEVTSLELLRVTRMGRQRISEYFPSLEQSCTDNSEIEEFRDNRILVVDSMSLARRMWR